MHTSSSLVHFRKKIQHFFNKLCKMLGMGMDVCARKIISLRSGTFCFEMLEFVRVTLLKRTVCSCEGSVMNTVLCICGSDECRAGL